MKIEIKGSGDTNNLSEAEILLYVGDGEEPVSIISGCSCCDNPYIENLPTLTKLLTDAGHEVVINNGLVCCHCGRYSENETCPDCGFLTCTSCYHKFEEECLHCATKA